MKKRYESQVLWQALQLLRRCDRGSFRRHVLYVMLQSVLPLVNLYILKLLIDTVEVGVKTGQGFSMVLPYVVVMAGVFFVSRVVNALSNVNNDVLSQRLIDYMSDIMQRKAAELDMAYYDTPEYHDTMHRAQQEANYRPMQILNNFMSFVGSSISIVGVVALLAASSATTVAVMIVAVVPGFLIRLYKARSIYAFRHNNTQLYRQTAYYSALLTARDYAKEVRAYRLSDMLRGRFVAGRRRLVSLLLAISRRIGALDVVCGAFETAAMLGVVWMLASQAFAAAISIGTFVMLFEAFRRGQTYLGTMVSSIAALYDNRLFVGNLFEFLNLKGTIASPADPVPFPEKVQTVEFRDVVFRYPDMDHDVLDHYNAVARVGEVFRLSGQNGYGKSTVVKLLLRLYDPQQGAVLINGIDLRRFDLDDLRTHVGVLFQDFVRYNLTATENIAMASKRGAQVVDAARQAGADEFLSKLPNGYENMLGRMFDGGSELSMGQWQRVALARAIYNDSPILVLDEPSAWLDHDARERLQQLVDESHKTKIVILISHI